MATYKKRFASPNRTGVMSPISGAAGGNWNNPDGTSGNTNTNDFGFRNYQSRLPEVYVGHPNRIERYNSMETMDCDPEINSCLDILSEFSTQLNEHNKTPFDIEFNGEPTQTEVELVSKQLQQWCKLNEFGTRIFKIFRNTIKYGDQVFVRDPETFKLSWVDMTKVVKVIVNESEGKKPEQYVLRDVDVNLQNLTIAPKTTTDFATTGSLGIGGAGGSGGSGQGYAVPSANQVSGGRFTMGITESAIDAKHVVHISLTEGLDRFWPFGQSILENIFKIYKQKELLEDAVLIYRVQRAPERRVFKIDVGNMPSNQAMAFVNRIKDEIHQRRIPSIHGGGAVVDATYNPLCLDLGTRIPLLDGRTLPLSEIIDEFKDGKQNWAYSCDPVTGKVVPGLIDWAGVTRKNTDVIKVTLDNGESFICTPDHKIPVFGRGFVEAQNLTMEDSLIAFNTRNEKISGGKTNDYQQVWDHETKSWIWTHRMVGEFFRGMKKHQEFCYLPENANRERSVIHHRDFDRFNNHPANLTYMNKEDHILFHASRKKEFWETMTEEYRAEMCGKISATVKENWANMTEEDRQSALWNIRSAQKKAVWMRQNDPGTKASYKINAGASRKKYFAENPEALGQVRKNCEQRVKIKNQQLVFTFDMLQCVADIVRSGITNKNEVLAECDRNTKLMSLVKEHNSTPLDYKNAHCKIDFNKFGYNKMDDLLVKFGYKNWKHFVKTIDQFNHRIVSIEKVENRDTGTITIDGTSKYHDYHTFAIESGIFVKNSINEDYFFPVNSEGRGSSVEMLQGGQNLGEIDDLKYFNNRLARGLRIPSSYLPTGPEDSQVPLSDGRVGTAMIQEYRFNQYCERLQGYIARKLNTEFKLFMRWRGFNIDSGLFDIKFTPPQNFASYRQAELDTARVNTFQTMSQLPFMSTRFCMDRFLGLSEEEIKKNQKLWHEERSEPSDDENAAKGSDLRSIGISTGDMESDLDMAGDMEDGGDMDGMDAMGAEPIAPVSPAPAGGGGAAPPPM